MNDYERAIKECHQLLTEAGVEECIAGTPCSNPKCQSKLYHRIHTMIEKQDSEPKAKYIKVQVGNKIRSLRYVKNILISGKYVCGGDDLFDLGFTVDELEANKVYLIMENGLTIELTDQKDKK